MRCIPIALFILLVGCLGANPEQPQLPNESAPPPQPAPQPSAQQANQTSEPFVSGNITALPETPAANATNASDNQGGNNTTTVAPIPPERPPQPEKPEGLLFANGSYSLALDDVSVIPTSEEPCGIFSIRHPANGTVIEKFFLCPGESQNWESPEGGSYRILVVEVAAGYTKEAKWARVIIFG
ncbi:MAG: hypothetical protein V1861_03220 [Candidatus Micrarchaeota archaeon]